MPEILNLLKKTLQKCVCLAVLSKYLAIIRILSPSITCFGTTSQKNISNSLISKYKKATSIVYIIKSIVNTHRHNNKQAKQIKDSLFSFKEEAQCQGQEGNTSNLPLELRYPLINEFCDNFGNETSIEKLSIYKNVEKYENMVRYFYIQLVQFT